MGSPQGRKPYSRQVSNKLLLSFGNGEKTGSEKSEDDERKASVAETLQP